MWRAANSVEVRRGGGERGDCTWQHWTVASTFRNWPDGCSTCLSRTGHCPPARGSGRYFGCHGCSCSVCFSTRLSSRRWPMVSCIGPGVRTMLVRLGGMERHVPDVRRLKMSTLPFGRTRPSNAADVGPRYTKLSQRSIKMPICNKSILGHVHARRGISQAWTCGASAPPEHLRKKCWH